MEIFKYDDSNTFPLGWKYLVSECVHQHFCLLKSQEQEVGEGKKEIKK